MKKKKNYLMLILALMCIFSVTVNAEGGGYNPGANSYTNSITEGAKTVIIYKGEDFSTITGDDIYYIDQSNEENGFSNLEMLMRLDAPAGTYTVAVEGGNKTTFEISDAQSAVSGANKMTFLGVQQQSDSSYSVAFGFGVKSFYNTASKLSMIIGDKAYSTDMFGETSIIDWGSLGVQYTQNEQGENEFMFAIQVDGVGADYINTESLTPKFELYFK